MGFHQSGSRLVQEGYLQEYQALPFLAADGLGAGNSVYESILQTAKQMEPNFIFFQYFHFHRIPDPSQLVAGLRKLPSRPVIFSSGGDSFGRWTRPVPSSLRTLSRIGDLTFLTGMGYVADDLVRSGAKNIALMPNGFCPVRFPPMAFGTESSKPEWELVCVANDYPTKNPGSYLFYHKLCRRHQIHSLARRYGRRFALFGKGWEGIPGWLGPLPYEKQAEVYRKSRVVVGGHPGGAMDYYLSDRDFVAICSNPILVDRWIPRVEKIFQPDQHWFLYRTFKEMFQKIDQLLDGSESDLQSKRVETEKYIRNKHSQYHRLKEMLRLAQDFREARKRNCAYEPRLEFFLPGTNWEEEKKHALRGWSVNGG